MKYYKAPSIISRGFITHEDWQTMKFEIVKDIVKVDGPDIDSTAWGYRNNLISSDATAFSTAVDSASKSTIEYRITELEKRAGLR